MQLQAKGGSMNQNDKTKFLNIMNQAAIVFEKDLSTDFINIYWQIFKCYELNQFSNAMNTIIRKQRFFPRPVDILELLEGSKEYLAQELAGYLTNSIIGKEYKNPAGWQDDPTAKKLLRGRFNVERLRENSWERDLRFIEKDFIEAYLDTYEFSDNENKIIEFKEIKKLTF